MYETESGEVVAAQGTSPRVAVMGRWMSEKGFTTTPHEYGMRFAGLALVRGVETGRMAAVETRGERCALPTPICEEGF